MGLISPVQAADGTTPVNAASVNNPINTIANEFNGNIDNSNIKAAAAIATAKLASDNGILAAMLSSSAISLAFTAATTTTGVTGATDIVASSTVVTIPPGGRRILIIAWCSASSASANTGPTLAINGAGSDIDSAAIFMATAGTGNQMIALATETPGAGSRTYKLRGSSNNATSFTSPKMLILAV